MINHFDHAGRVFVGACALVASLIGARSCAVPHIPAKPAPVVVAIGDAGVGDPTDAEVRSCAGNGPIDGQYAAINENAQRTAWICEIGG